MKKLKVEKENNDAEFMGIAEKENLGGIIKEVHRDMMEIVNKINQDGIDDKLIEEITNILLVDCDMLAREYIENF